MKLEKGGYRWSIGALRRSCSQCSGGEVNAKASRGAVSADYVIRSRQTRATCDATRLTSQAAGRPLLLPYTNIAIAVVAADNGHSM